MTDMAAPTMPRIPETTSFYCPIRPAVHPRAAEFGAIALSWLEEQDLDIDAQQRRRLTQCDFGGLTGRTMPYGLPGPLTITAKLHAVLFALDDGLCDEAKATPHELARETSRVLRVLEAPASAWRDESPYTAALRGVRLELQEYASPSQLRRWVEGMRLYMSGLVWEAACRRDCSLPSLDDYIPMWMRAIGMAPSTALIGIVAGHGPSDADLDRPAVRALTEMTWTLVAWDNDFYSRRKEIERAADNLNLIDVLAQERGCGLLRAQEEAVALRDRVMVRFLRLYQQLRAPAPSSLRLYLDGLAHFVRGHLDWASTCRRYAPPPETGITGTAGAPGSVPPPEGWWAHAPSDTGTEPLPVPSIAWWWDEPEA